MNTIAFHIHTSFSLLDGIVKPEKFALRCKELGYKHAMITDHGNVSGCIKFASAMEKQDITPILGCEMYTTYKNSHIKKDDNRKLFHTVVAAKNKESWVKLMQAVSLSNHPDNFYYKPRLDFEKLASIVGDTCFIFSGHPGSYLWDFKTKEDLIIEINYLKGLFGDNLYLEIQRFLQDDEVDKHIQQLIQAGKETNTKCVACQDIHYTNREDAQLQRIVLCSNLKRTLPQINQMASKDKPMATFFETEKFYLYSQDELKGFGHTDEELDFSCIIDQLKPFKTQNQPMLPKYSENEAEELTQWCREGWKRKSKVTWGQEYVDRFKEEIEVFKKWNLCGYFLIVADYIKWAKEQGMFVNYGRGSVGGSLIAYLTDITEIDPIKWGLFFSRFFNESRCSPDNISLPDIDTDFPANRRDEVIQYIRHKYGPEYVCQIATFGTLKGKAAISEVFKVCEVCDFETVKKITKPMPDKEDIADELEEQDEESIIRWCLINQPKMFQGYCELKDGKYTGEYSEYFKLAIELEGIHKSQGKHAGGVVVSSKPLADICPIVYDGKTGEVVVAFDKKDVEKIGLVKLDILGLSALDKLMTVNNLLRYGKVSI